jgi:hypothetical protein
MRREGPGDDVPERLSPVRVTIEIEVIPRRPAGVTRTRYGRDHYADDVWQRRTHRFGFNFTAAVMAPGAVGAALLSRELATRLYRALVVQQWPDLDGQFPGDDRPGAPGGW